MCDSLPSGPLLRRHKPPNLTGLEATLCGLLSKMRSGRQTCTTPCDKNSEKGIERGGRARRPDASDGTSSLRQGSLRKPSVKQAWLTRSMLEERRIGTVWGLYRLYKVAMLVNSRGSKAVSLLILEGGGNLVIVSERPRTHRIEEEEHEQ